MPSKTCPSCRASYPADVEICPQDGSALQSEREWLSGAIISGRYAISRRLDEDEASVCYQARVLDSGESRVVRVLRSGFAADTSAVREFRRVGRLLQKVAHPNVLRVEAVGEAQDGRPFLVTELIEAPSLEEVLRDGKPFEMQRACALARGIAAALDACHRFGLLHLNLQPRNILLTGSPGDEHVKVRGFGTGYIWAARPSDQHRSGKALRDLTPAALAYSSPEQALARSPESLDARSDLYSLGLLLFRMLTGRLPFESRLDGEDAALALLAVRLEEAPGAGEAERDGSGLPGPLAELVMQLLERRPELRPATAKAVIDKVGLAEARIAGLETPALEFPPPEVESVPAQGIDGFRARVASALAGEERKATAPVSPKAVFGLDAFPLDSATPPVARSPRGPAAAPETAETPAAAAGVASGVQPSGWTDSNSILFRDAVPAGAPKRTGWVWVAAVLVVAAGAWLFVHRGSLEWHGPGPLSRYSYDQIRAMMGGGATRPGAPATPASQPGASQQPSANPVQGAPGLPAAAANPPGPAAALPGNPPPSNAAKQEPAPTGTASAAPASSTTPEASQARTSSPAQGAKAGSAQEETIAEVNRAVAAGDVFFELGQYDLAVKAYEGPLKLDPNNKVLHSKIDRALKAKAAEQQFLGQ